MTKIHTSESNMELSLGDNMNVLTHVELVLFCSVVIDYLHIRQSYMTTVPIFLPIILSRIFGIIVNFGHGNQSYTLFDIKKICM